MRLSVRFLVAAVGKGAKDRITTLPGEALAVPLREQLLLRARAATSRILQMGLGARPLCRFALARKYRCAGRDWGWQFVFPSTAFCLPRSLYGLIPCCFHLHQSTCPAWRSRKPRGRCRVSSNRVTPAHAAPRIRYATAGARVTTSAQCKSCSDIRMWKTTMIYTHVLNRGGRGVRSPLDR